MRKLAADTERVVFALAKVEETIAGVCALIDALSL